MMTGTSTRLRMIGALAAGLLLVGCTTSGTPVPEPSPTEDAAPAAATCQTKPKDLRSYAPSRDGGPSTERIREAGVLRVGVSADTLRMGARNPATNEIEGFDIDLAREIADQLGVTMQLRVINAAQRIELLANGEIDIVARNFTINCSRWKDIAFSAEYYHSGQKVLLGSDSAPDYESQGVSALRGKRVCAPSGTTSLANIQAAEPEALAVPADSHTGCLVKFQQGEVDAITGDDTVLAGLSAQDPYAEVPNQTAFTDEPYGIGVDKDNVDLVQFINAVLQQYVASGQWQTSYDRWLRDVLGPPSAANPPIPAYGR